MSYHGDIVGRRWEKIDEGEKEREMMWW